MSTLFRAACFLTAFAIDVGLPSSSSYASSSSSLVEYDEDDTGEEKEEEEEDRTMESSRRLGEEERVRFLFSFSRVGERPTDGRCGTPFFPTFSILSSSLFFFVFGVCFRVLREGRSLSGAGTSSSSSPPRPTTKCFNVFQIKYRNGNTRRAKRD